MRTITKLVGLSVAVLAAACGRDKQPTTDAALTKDLKAAANANLTLAGQQAGSHYAVTETAPKAAALPTPKLKRAEGPRAVESPAPTIAAAPEPTVAATIEVPQTQLVEVAQNSAPTVDALPAVGRPVPAPTGLGDLGAGEGGSVYGGGPRVVIRGGGIGDDDHCEPPGRRPGGIDMGGVFIPGPGTMVNRPIPIGTFPTGGATVGRPGGAAGGGIQRRGGRGGR